MLYKYLTKLFYTYIQCIRLISVRSYTVYYPLTYYLRMYMQYTILYFIHTFLIISTIHTYKHTLQYQVLYTNTFRYVYTCIILTDCKMVYVSAQMHIQQKINNPTPIPINTTTSHTIAINERVTDLYRQQTHCNYHMPTTLTKYFLHAPY